MLDDPFSAAAVLFVSAAAVLCTAIYFSFRARAEYQKTVRAAIEHGQQLTLELLERLGDGKRGANRDLRIGVTSMALGVALASFGWLLGDSDFVGPMLAIGNIPFLVGLALLGLWKFAPKEGR
jgi:uncharacterized protein DUF6249